MSPLLRAGRGRDEGQALVEFSIAIIVFLLLLMAVFDFGRGIYMYNGVSEAARDVARCAVAEKCQGIDNLTPTTGYGAAAQTRITTQ
jgi:Flp pilus assembly protein TadG